MPWHVKRSGQCSASKPFGVLDENGKLVTGGCHPTEGEARAHMETLQSADESDAKKFYPPWDLVDSPLGPMPICRRCRTPLPRTTFSTEPSEDRCQNCDAILHFPDEHRPKPDPRF